MVTHDVSEAVTLADRILLLEDGGIALDVAVDLPRPRRRGDRRANVPCASTLEPTLHRATKALASVASAKWSEIASFSTPRIPEGVIAQASDPQFSSSQAVI